MGAVSAARAGQPTRMAPHLRPVFDAVRALAVLLSVAVWASPAWADIDVPDLASFVPGHDDLTYLDLARFVAPDLKPDEASRLVALRRLDGEAPARPEATRLSLSGVVPLGQGHRLLMLLEGDSEHTPEGLAILALFDLRGSKPRLSAAADVTLDRLNGFGEPPLLKVGPQEWVVQVVGMHVNAGQAYSLSSLVLVRGGRFQLIDTIFTLNDQTCAFARTQAQGVRAGRATGKRLAPLEVTVTETVRPTGQECGDEAVVPKALGTARATYRWNGAEGRYEPDSDAVRTVEKANQDRL